MNPWEEFKSRMKEQNKGGGSSEEKSASSGKGGSGTITPWQDYKQRMEGRKKEADFFSAIEREREPVKLPELSYPKPLNIPSGEGYFSYPGEQIQESQDAFFRMYRQDYDQFLTGIKDTVAPYYMDAMEEHRASQPLYQSKGYPGLTAKPEPVTDLEAHIEPTEDYYAAAIEYAKNVLPYAERAGKTAQAAAEYEESVGELNDEWRSRVRSSEAVQTDIDNLPDDSFVGPTRKTLWEEELGWAQYFEYEKLLDYDLEAGQKKIDDLSRAIELKKNMDSDAYADPSANRHNRQAYQRILKNYGLESTDDLEDLVTQETVMFNRSRVAQKEAEMASVVDNPDFAQYSQAGAAIENPSYWDAIKGIELFGWRPFADDVQNKVTFARDNAQALYDERMKGDGNAAHDPVVDHLLRHVNDEEAAIYNYYLAKYGEDKADEYLETIYDKLNQREAAGEYARVKGNTGLELMYAATVGADQFKSGILGLGDLITGSEELRTPSAIQYAGQMVRQDVADRSTVGAVAYDVISTTTNMVPSILASTAIGMVSKTAGSVVGSALLGASAAGNAYTEKINAGYSKEQARDYGLLVGASEIVLEYALGGISKLGGGALSKVAIKGLDKVDNVLARVAKSTGGKILMNAGSEAFEEGVQSILEPYIWQAVSGEEGSVDWEETLYNSLLGFITGGVFEAGDVAVNYAAQKLNTHNGSISNTENGSVSAPRMIDIKDDSNFRLIPYEDKDSQNNITSNIHSKMIEEGKVVRIIESDVVSEHYPDLRSMKKADRKLIIKENVSKLKGKIREFLTGLKSNDYKFHVNDGVLEARIYDKGIKEVTERITKDKANLLYQTEEIFENAQYLYSTPDYEGNPAIYRWDYFYTPVEINGETVGVRIAIRDMTKSETSQIYHWGIKKSPSLDGGVGQQAVSQTDVSSDGDSTILPQGVSSVNSNFAATANLTGVDSTISEEVSDSTVEADTSVRLEKASKKYGAQAKAMVMTFNPGQDVAAFDRAYGMAYQMGKSGVSMDYAVNSRATSYLTQAQRELAYRQGAFAATNKAKTADALYKGMGSTEGGRRKGAVKLEGIKASEFRKMLKDSNDPRGKAAKVLMAIAEVTGIDIVLFKSQEDASGRYMGAQGRFEWKNDTIYIDVNAGLSYGSDAGELTKYAMLRTFGHEFTHFLEKNAASQYSEFRKLVFAEMTKAGKNVDDLIRWKQDQYKNQNQNLSYEAASREVVAESMGDILRDSNFVETLAQKHNSLFKTLLDQFKRFIRNIRSYFNSLAENSSPEAKALKEEINGTLKYMDSIVEAFDKLAVEAVENYQARMAESDGIVAELTPGQEGVVVDKDGEPVAYSTEDGTVMLSIRTYEEQVQQADHDLEADLLNEDRDASYDSYVQHSVRVYDEDTLEFLNGQETIKTYKTMQIVDGKLYPPMAARTKGQYEDHSILGTWEQATEHPELITKDGKYKLDKGKGQGNIEAAYNPYMHSSDLPINDQFTSAYKRGNLVTVECEVPVSEMSSGYHAQYAKDSVGWHSWHTGTVAGAIRKARGVERRVFLSRWIKPVRIVPDSEVASMYKELIADADIAIPDNVVTPSLLSELKNIGVNIAESGKVQYQVRDYSKATKNTTNEGGVPKNMKKISINRYIIPYKDKAEQWTAIDSKAVDLESRGKVINLTAENVFKYKDAVQWDDKKAVRNFLKTVLSPNHGISVYFEYNGQIAIAYLTGEGINHSVGGYASPRKAAAFEAFRELVKNAEYTFSSLHDEHSEIGKNLPEETIWDFFVSVAMIDGKPYPVAFKLRTTDSDVRSQIYEMYQIKEDGVFHGAGKQESADGHPNYESIPSSGGTITQEKGDVKDDVQNQLRTNTLTDHEILDMAAKELDTSKLTDGERAALDIFRKKVTTLKALKEERQKQGSLYYEAQFGDNRDKAKASAARNRMSVLDKQITRASAEVLSVEDKKVLKDVLQKSRKVIEQHERKASLNAIRAAREETRARERKRADERVKALRDAKNQRIAEVRAEERQHGQEVLDKYRENRNNSEAIKKYQDKIKKDVGDLMAWLLKPDNKTVKKHIPEPLKNVLVPFLSGIDFSSKRSLNGGEDTKKDFVFRKRLHQLQRYAAEAFAADDYYGQYLDLPPDFLPKLKSLCDSVDDLMESAGGEYILNRMTPDELKALSDVLRTLKKAITQINTFHNNQMFKHVDDAAEDTIGFLAPMKPLDKNTAASRFLLWKQMRPAYVFERFGKGGISVYDGFRRGQSALAFDTKRIAEFAAKAYTAKEVKSWEEDRRTIKLSDGQSVTMSIAQIMGLYELSKREQALVHIMGEGIRPSTFKNTNADSGHQLTEEDLNNILTHLSTRQKAVADSLQQFMEKVGGEWGNQVTIARFGEKQFGEPHYYPINSDRWHLNANADEMPGNTSLYALLNMSFTKQTVEGANNRIVVFSIFDVFASHMSSMAQYHAFALPVLDALKWFNYKRVSVEVDGDRYVKNVDDSVREELNRVYGVPHEQDKQKSGYAESFILNILKALNGTEAQGTNYDSVGLKALNRTNRSQIAFNLRVVVQQPTAIARAALLLDYSSIMKGLNLSPGKIKGNIQEMLNHSGIALWKSLGFYDINVSRNLTSMIKHDSNIVDKIMDVGTWGAETADKLTWSAIWSACKAEVSKKQRLHPGEDGYYEAVTQLFEEVVYKTQVVDSILTKTEFMRDNGFFAKASSSFMSEPITTANAFFDVYDKYLADRRSGMSRAEAWKKNGQKLGRTAYTFAISTVLLAAVQSIIDAGRDDEEYMTYWEKYKDKFWGNVLDEAMPFNKLPIVNDAYELVKEILSAIGWVDTYGSPPRSIYMQWWDSLVKGVKIISGRVRGDEDRYTWYAGIYKLLTALSQGAGLPIANVTRTVVNAWNNVVPYMAPSLRVKSYDAGDKNEIRYAYQDGYLTEEEATELLLEKGVAENSDDAYWMIREWETGESSKYSAVYDAVLKGSGFDEAFDEMVSHGYSDEDIYSQVKSQVGEWYSDPESKVRISKQQAETMLRQYTVMEEKDIAPTILKWTCRVVTGIKYDDIMDAHFSGQISEKRAAEMYVKYGGYGTEEAKAKVTYGKWRHSHPGQKDLSDQAIERFLEHCEPAGVSAETFYKAKKYTSTVKGDGTPGSKKAQYVEYIESLDIPYKQQRALWYALKDKNWSDSDTPF